MNIEDALVAMEQGFLNFHAHDAMRKVCASLKNLKEDSNENRALVSLANHAMDADMHPIDFCHALDMIKQNRVHSHE